MKIKEGGVMDIQEKKAFEAWVGSNGRSIERFSDGSYKSMTLDKEWEAWQAAKTQAVPEKDAVIKKLSDQLYAQEKKAFEIAFDEKLGARRCQFNLDEDGNYEDRETLCGWHMWQAAKTQAVPEGFVLVPKKLNQEPAND